MGTSDIHYNSHRTSNIQPSRETLAIVAPEGFQNTMSVLTLIQASTDYHIRHTYHVHSISRCYLGKIATEVQLIQWRFQSHLQLYWHGSLTIHCDSLIAEPTYQSESVSDSVRWCSQHLLLFQTDAAQQQLPVIHLRLWRWGLPSFIFFLYPFSLSQSLRNCNCNWGTCIAPPPTRRLRAHHRVNPYLGAHRQNETKMFSDHDKTSPSIAAVFLIIPLVFPLIPLPLFFPFPSLPCWDVTR